ncbi:MAG TPA: ribosome maturation factor RimM [Syntrophorhabdaceae bacterium]|nr:ribosome maturation factor RimM [Syntrophorhabdaceae bacterium]
MKWIPVGRVVSTQGVRGEIKFYYYNEVHEDILRYTSLFIVQNDAETELKPKRVRFQGNRIIIQFEGVTDKNIAASLVNKELFVREKDLDELDEGEYYEYQLIGLEVLDSKGKKVGSVDTVLNTGAHNVLIVKGEKSFAVPLVEGFITEVNVSRGNICIDEGALEL